MKKTMLLFSFAVIGLSVIAGNPKERKGQNAEIVKVDPSKSTLKWHAEKVTGKHDGTVKFANGTLSVAGKILTGGTIEVDMTTIDDIDLQGEHHDKLVNHLKSEDFFSVVKYPKAILVIKKAQEIKDKKGAENFDITADLTIKGIVQEITFPAIIVINKTEVVANADFNIDRTKYDIKYGSKSFFSSIGDKAINDEFNIKVRIVALK